MTFFFLFLVSVCCDLFFVKQLRLEFDLPDDIRLDAGNRPPDPQCNVQSKLDVSLTQTYATSNCLGYGKDARIVVVDERIVFNTTTADELSAESLAQKSPVVSFNIHCWQVNGVKADGCEKSGTFDDHEENLVGASGFTVLVSLVVLYRCK